MLQKNIFPENSWYFSYNPKKTLINIVKEQFPKFSEDLLEIYAIEYEPSGFYLNYLVPTCPAQTTKRLYEKGAIEIDEDDWVTQWLSGCGQFYTTTLISWQSDDFPNACGVRMHYAAESPTSGIFAVMVEYDGHVERVPIWRVFDIVVEKIVLKNHNVPIFGRVGKEDCEIYNTNCKVELLLE